MFDNLFQKYRDNKEYIQELNLAIEKLSDLRKPEWDKSDSNWFTANQVNSEDEFTTLGHLEELREFGIVESKNSPSTNIKIYKLKPQHYNVNLGKQFDNWLIRQVKNTQTNIVENYTNSNVIKGSTIQESQLQFESENAKQSKTTPTNHPNANEPNEIIEFIKKFWWAIIIPILLLIVEHKWIAKLFNGE